MPSACLLAERVLDNPAMEHNFSYCSFCFTTADSGKQETLINEAVLLIEEASKLDGLDPTTLITLISYVAGKCGGS